MRLVISLVFCLLTCSFVQGQKVDSKWYSETESNGVVIQNSYPKGGRYPGSTDRHFNYSYLVFYTRVVNETANPLEISLNFSSDSIPIPNSPDTFVKLFLPADKMTQEKEQLLSYGIMELESLYDSTGFQKLLNPQEDCLFYVVAVFFQTRSEAWEQERGGNRAELILKGNDLFYRMTPQIESLPCGEITSKN